MTASAGLLVLVVVGYVAHAVTLLLRVPVNDVEQAMLGDRRRLALRWAVEFGGVMPTRYPWRLPLEYAIWPPVFDLRQFRIFGLIIGAIGVGGGAWWSAQHGGLVAVAVTVALVATSPTLLAGLTSASYVPWVSTLWTVGLVAGDGPLAAGCGVALALLRPTSWWQAGYLLVAARAWWLLGPLAALIWWQWPDVVRAQGWVRLLRREPCPVRGIPRDGWWYGIKVAGRRFPLFVLGTGYVAAAGSAHARWLLALTAVLFVATHLPRMLIRPKWAVGYLPDWLVPGAVAVAIA